MQRRKAITTAASISLALFSAATAMAVNTGLLLSPPHTGVGQLSAVPADAVGPAPADSVPPQSPPTIIVTVPRSGVAGPAPAAATPAATVTTTGAPATIATTTTTTVRRAKTSTTRNGDDDHTVTTSTSRPDGGDDDD